MFLHNKIQRKLNRRKFNNKFERNSLNMQNVESMPRNTSYIYIQDGAYRETCIQVQSLQFKEPTNPYSWKQKSHLSFIYERDIASCVSHDVSRHSSGARELPRLSSSPQQYHDDKNDFLEKFFCVTNVIECLPHHTNCILKDSREIKLAVFYA